MVIARPIQKVGLAFLGAHFSILFFSLWLMLSLAGCGKTDSEREMMDMVATGVLQGTRGGLFADANPRYVLFMLLFAFFSMVVVMVILRYASNATIIGGNEVTVIAFVYTTAIGSATSISRDERIAIRYFTNK